MIQTTRTANQEPAVVMQGEGSRRIPGTAVPAAKTARRGTRWMDAMETKVHNLTAERDALKALNAELVAALEGYESALNAAVECVLMMADDIARADHESRSTYYGAGEIGDVARVAARKSRSAS